MSKLTAERLREVLHYNPKTGEFVRIADPSSRSPLNSVVGTRSKKNGVVICVDGRSYRAHWLAILYVTGEWPTEEVDHINGDGYDNTWKNLRQCSHRENMRNCKLRKDSPLGITGVGVYRDGRYRVRHPDGPFMGYFTDFFEACCARKAYENSSGFHTNHGRRKDV